MPNTITDPFGNSFEVCSISTMVKAKFGKDAFASEAQWAKHVKADAWHVIQQKIDTGEIKANTIVGRAPGGYKLKVTKHPDTGKPRISTFKGTEELDAIGPLVFEQTGYFNQIDWDFGPNMAKIAKQDQAIVNSPAKLQKYMQENDVPVGTKIADVTHKSGLEMQIEYNGIDADGYPEFLMKSKTNPNGTQLGPGELDYVIGPGSNYTVDYKVGQVPAEIPVGQGLPVASTSKSVGALTNEDAATMFVKTKDKLATEQGLNIKGANPALDHLVYKTIADQAGYTPGEMMAKVEAYKASGKKLSSLKKKVLPKSGNSTKVATEKAVDNAAAAVKKETPKPEEVPQVWDSEAVAKAYVKAKDHVVAVNDQGWTLYTQKNPAFDKEVLKWMQADLGPIKQETADTAIADYIANHQKLSVLKKQMVKNGELTKEAPTLKGGKKAAAEAADAEPVVKVAPQETGFGQTGKATEDPKLVAKELPGEQKQDIFDDWEGSNLPLSSSGQALYEKAKGLAGQYGLGDDVLPVLKALDEFKAKKFGSPNTNLYEKKVVEYLKNPKPAGYNSGGWASNPSHTASHAKSATYGELPEDSSLFKEMSPQQMHSVATTSMPLFTAEQKSALQNYTGSYYADINQHLRGGGSMTSKGQLIKNAMSPVPENIVVRRGTSLKGLGMHSPDELATAVGTRFTEPGFSSTAVGGQGQFNGAINLVIQVPKGTKAAWLKPISSFSHENELLLDAGTKFEVLKVEQIADGYATRNVVTVRVVGQK